MLDLPTIKLTSGKGHPGQAACWMSALSQYTGVGKWTDRLECVSLVINELCIKINDALSSDEARERIIMPMLFDPLGTKDDEAEPRRRAHLIRCAGSRWVPLALRAAAKACEVDPSPENLKAAQKAAHAADAYAAYAASAADAAASAADAAASAADAADAAASAYADDARDQFIINEVVPILHELIQMGAHAKEEPACAMPLDEWAAVCGGGH